MQESLLTKQTEEEGKLSKAYYALYQNVICKEKWANSEEKN